MTALTKENVISVSAAVAFVGGAFLSFPAISVFDFSGSASISRLL